MPFLSEAERLDYFVKKGRFQGVDVCENFFKHTLQLLVFDQVGIVRHLQETPSQQNLIFDFHELFKNRFIKRGNDRTHSLDQLWLLEL